MIVALSARVGFHLGDSEVKKPVKVADPIIDPKIEGMKME